MSMNAGRRRDLPPPARNKAAVRLMRSINPEKNYKEIPKIVSIVLSIDPRAEVDILEWLKPVLGSIPWRSVDCRLLSFEHSPVGKWCIAMLHPATVSDFDRIVHVPYSTDDGDVSGQVAAAVYPGDAVSLPAHRDVWYTVYEIRADRNCVLIATAEADTLLNPAKVKSERKIWRNYMEVNTVHFLGCTVKREVIIGPLREVVDDWQPASDSTSELLRNQDCLYYRRIYFQIPKADPTSALKKLSTLSRSFTGAFENNLTGSTRPVHEKPGVSFVRKAKIIKQPKLFQQTQEETIVRSASRKQSRENPVESFQRLKHVQVWAARKVELSLAARALDTINPNPLLYTLDDTFNEFGDRSHLVDSLQLSRKRREVWLQVGRALRAVSRGTEGHILLSAWKQWTRRGISERAALTKKIQRARDLFGDAGEMVPASALETPDETACVAAWYSQRLPTNCDEGPIVEARSYLRRRIQELSKRNNNINDLSAAVIGGVFDSDGNICAENCTDDICQSVLISAAAASEYVSNTEAELHFVSEMVPKSAERQSSSRSTLRVPSATHTCTRANEYWRERVDDKVVADTDNITLDEVTEAPAIIRRGDILHLPMGRDDAADESTPIYGGVQQYAQSRWCQVLAVDILFARLWVRPSAAAPHCWLDDIEDESVGYRKVADSYWVPVSLLWDAVVFSPYHYSTSNFSRSALFTGFDVVKSAVHNGISILKCQYCAFNVPMLSSSEAIDMLRALGERYPNAAVIREISS